MSNVIVVGGGAAGMMAAVFAARNGQNVQLLEKNEKLGKKLFITGKGRCNITNAADIEDLFTAVISNPKFLYSGFYSFTNQQVIDFFEELFGHRGGANGGRSAGFRGQDYNAELQLSLREAAETHKQVLNVNGKNIRITVPAGIANGQTIKLRGHGAPGVNGGPAGDLYITFVIPDDPVFKRLGNDLYIHAPLSLYTAVLGGEETVDTLNGKVKLKVKPETQNGTKVRLKGKGFPVYKEEGKFGDLIVTYNVTIPSNLTEHQKELFRQLKDSSN